MARVPGLLKDGGRRLSSVANALLLSSLVACGSSATAPSPRGYVGEWTGNTNMGTPIHFSVSGKDEVTSASVAYNFSATCSGTLTYMDVAAPIHRLDPPQPPPYDQPGFGITTDDGPGGSATAVVGWFSADRQTAAGQFTLVHYDGCGLDGTVVGTWSAHRQ